MAHASEWNRAGKIHNLHQVGGVSGRVGVLFGSASVWGLKTVAVTRYLIIAMPMYLEVYQLNSNLRLPMLFNS